jgi:hypothetical protein
MTVTTVTIHKLEHTPGPGPAARRSGPLASDDLMTRRVGSRLAASLSLSLSRTQAGLAGPGPGDPWPHCIIRRGMPGSGLGIHKLAQSVTVRRSRRVTLRGRRATVAP